MLMASKCPNLGKQVRTTNYDWSDNDEPILSSPPIRKEDSYEWNPRADCLCLTVLLDKPIEPMESPVGSRLKNLTKPLALIRYYFTLSPLVQATKFIFLTKDVV
jgi:hypothetical protein